MKVVTHEDASEFEAATRALLITDEAENNLLLSLAATLVRDPSRYASKWTAHVADEDDVLVGAAVWTPPFPMVISRAPVAAIDALVDHVVDARIGAKGVQGPPAAIDPFVARWTARTGRSTRVAMNFGTYSLTRVIDPKWSGGPMRAATLDDIATVAPWIGAFVVETGVESPGVPWEAVARRLIDAEALFVWQDDDRLVTMAVSQSATPNGARIGYVYTPKELRGRGYASSCVAKLSQRILDGGKTFAFLFTDLTNPTSNKIYQRIGYEYRCEMHWHSFTPALPSTP